MEVLGVLTCVNIRIQCALAWEWCQYNFIIIFVKKTAHILIYIQLQLEYSYLNVTANKLLQKFTIY